MDCTKTLNLRIKDKHAKTLLAMAREVNTVWNFINEVSFKAAVPYSGAPRYLSGYDLQKLIAGIGKEGMHIPSYCAQQVCEEYATRRKQFKRKRLNWRVSSPKSSKYSLGWIPFKKGAVAYKSGQVRFAGRLLSLWDSYGLSDYELRAGSFNEDSRGRWYLNVVVKIRAKPSVGTKSIGIDLGWKTAATVSDSQVIEGRWYRDEEKRLATAQRAGKKLRAKAIHAKIANRRKDAMHKLSTKLVSESGAIFVGNVASAAMVKCNGKSTLDAGWAMFKTMLEYKCRQAGVVFEEVNEAYSTQTCSSCGSICGPKGRAELDVRRWVCSDCGSEHDRDVNAALNIRAKGIAALAISAAAEAKASETAVNEAQAEVGHGLPAEGILAL